MNSRVIAHLVGGLSVLLCVAFYRGVSNAYDLTKATLLWASLPVLIFTASTRRRFRKENFDTVSYFALVLAVALVASLLVSPDRWLSFWGQTERFTGVMSWLVALLVFSACRRVETRDRRIVFNYLFAGVFAHVFYCYLQFLNWDPFEWTTSSFGVPVFGLVGNPNTAAGVIGCCLPFAVSFVLDEQQSERRRFAALLLSSFGSPSLIFLSSFQGTVAIVVGIFVIWIWLLFFQSSKHVHIPQVLFIFTTASVPFLGNTRSQVFFGVVAVFVGGVCCIYWPRQGRWALPSIRRTSIGLASLLGAALAFVFLRGRIIAEVEGGLLERGSFYRAAIAAWKEKPIFGWGFETFGLVFTRFRPESHAVRFEASRTSSVHSIPLGLLVNGGLVILVVVLVFQFSILQRGIRLIRQTRSLEEVGLFTVFVCFLIQGLVSVEHILFIVLPLVVAGLMSSDSAPPGRRKAVLRTSPTVLSLVSLSVILVIVLLVRPFRSERVYLNAMKEAVVEGNFVSASEKFEQSISLAPWAIQPKFRLSIVESELGDIERASDLSLEVAEETAFSPQVTPTAAIILVRAGRINEAVTVLEKSIEGDPFARGHRNEVDQLLEEIEAIAEENGDEALRERIKTLRYEELRAQAE